MASFGLPCSFTFAAATQQAIDLVRANRLTIGTSDECGCGFLSFDYMPNYSNDAIVIQRGD
jgi:hypothetical protein